VFLDEFLHVFFFPVETGIHTLQPTYLVFLISWWCHNRITSQWTSAVSGNHLERQEQHCCWSAAMLTDSVSLQKADIYTNIRLL